MLLNVYTFPSTVVANFSSRLDWNTVNLMDQFKPDPLAAFTRLRSERKSPGVKAARVSGLNQIWGKASPACLDIDLYVTCLNSSFIYSSVYFGMWHSHMQMKIVTESLFVLCKIVYIDRLSHNRAVSHHITSKFCSNQKYTFYYVV